METVGYNDPGTADKWGKRRTHENVIGFAVFQYRDVIASGFWMPDFTCAMAVCRPRPSARKGKTRGPAMNENDGLRKAQVPGGFLWGRLALPLRRKARSVVTRYRATAEATNVAHATGCLVAPEGTQKQNSDPEKGRSLSAHHPRNRKGS
jgi:hypothetical protein